MGCDFQGCWILLQILSIQNFKPFSSFRETWSQMLTTSYNDAMFCLIPDLFSEWSSHRKHSKMDQQNPVQKLNTKHHANHFEQRDKIPWKLPEKYSITSQASSRKPGSEESLVRAVSRSSRANCCNAGCALFLTGSLWYLFNSICSDIILT